MSFFVYFLGGSVKGFVLSADLVSLHLIALICGEDCFPPACLDEAFTMSIGIPPLDEAIFFFLHHGLTQAL